MLDRCSVDLSITTSEAIELVAYRVWHRDGKSAPTFHSVVRFVARNNLGEYEFAPADVPLPDALASSVSRNPTKA